MDVEGAVRDGYSLLAQDRAHDLVGLAEELAHADGETRYAASGITVVRYTSPSPPFWAEVDALSYCFVIQGAKQVRNGAVEHVYGPMRYVVLNSHSRFEVEVVRADPANPYLSCGLHLDPVTVNEIAAKMQAAAPSTGENSDFWGEASSPDVDLRLADATRRLLVSLRSGTDSAILVPLYTREIIYLLLHSVERQRLLFGSRVVARNDPIASSIRYMKSNIREPMTISSIADAVCMSESSFAHLFKNAVGTSPYQYLKNLRLERARDLILDSDVNVSEAACEVGYSSLSHFIGEFKRHFGATPRQYSIRLRGVETLDLRVSK